MKPFTFLRPTTIDTAVEMAAHDPAIRFLGGGTNLVDLMRENIERPEGLVDVTRLPFSEIHEQEDGTLSIGAGARNTVVAAHPLVRQRYPALSEAILSGASGQIRNMATVGGNLMQRTRCYYFYDHPSGCNKRVPHSGCDAIGGFNRIHAILGASDACVATHPSDMCVALAAFEATVQVVGPDGSRTIPFRTFHLLPGDTPHLETALKQGELITAVCLPPSAIARWSRYRKVRDRSSFAFALVSVAAAVEVHDGVIADVRLALGGVAHKPWPAVEAERQLRGAPATIEILQMAVDAELAPARSLTHNGFKIELARRTIVSVLSELIGIERTS